MKKSYYLFNPGTLSRKDNTLKFTPIDVDGNTEKSKYIPIEGISNLYIFGQLNVNSPVLNFLGKQNIPVHFFDYYEHYTGSFMPKEYLQSGMMHVEQTKAYLSKKKRLAIASQFIESSAHNIVKNLRYYSSRGKEALLLPQIDKILQLSGTITNVKAIDQLMGIEGNIRQNYYACFDHIIQNFEMKGREKQPPTNEINALMSFGNMLCYSLCLDQLYHTQLNPTISFLHEPGTRRFSLALDLAEVFKPLLVDRLIFKVLNKKILQKNHFDQNLNGVRLKETYQKKFLQEWEGRLNTTIKHRSLGKHVSYRYLIRLEAYKLAKHLLNVEPYIAFKMWW